MEPSYFFMLLLATVVMVYLLARLVLVFYFRSKFAYTQALIKDIEGDGHGREKS